MPAQLVERTRDRSELALAAAVVIATEAYIWLLASKAAWGVVFPIALIALLWHRQSQNLGSLGLRWSALVLSLRRWRALWIVTLVLFLFLGWHTLFRFSVLLRGCVYFAWCVLQQLAFQSAVYSVLRKHLLPRMTAALVAGVVFALLHAPNRVLMAGTLVWGVVSCLLFESCRSVLGLALLQIMFSSMLLWLVPYEAHHGLRVGPSYYRWAAPGPSRSRDQGSGKLRRGWREISGSDSRRYLLFRAPLLIWLPGPNMVIWPEFGQQLAAQGGVSHEGTGS